MTWFELIYLSLALKQEQTVSFLLGKVMQATSGRANPALARQLIEERINDTSG